MDTFLETGSRKGNFFPMQDWLLLINHEGNNHLPVFGMPLRSLQVRRGPQGLPSFHFPWAKPLISISFRVSPLGSIGENYESQGMLLLR